MDALRTWLSEHGTLVTWLTVISALMLIAGMILLPVLLVRMPADYFVRPEASRRRWSGRHPVLRALLSAGRNLMGALLVLLGIAMLVLPGQGVLTILAGLGLLDLPGKRRIELWIARQPPVRKGLDWLRARAGRPPLELPHHGG